VRRIRYLARARRDIAELYGYIENASHSSRTAGRFVNRLRDQCRHIAELPGVLGRPRPELAPDLRSFPFRGYLIIFRYAGEVLEIVNIVEGHRDIGAIFPRDDQ